MSERITAQNGQDEGVSLIKGRSLTQDAMRRFRRNKAAMASVFIVIVLVVGSLIGPSLLPHSYDDVGFLYRSAPSLETGHYFGTDGNARDLAARTLYGTRISLLVALTATFVSVMIGVTYGAIAGYFGGLTDNVMMRYVDIMIAFPYILIVILLMVMFGRNIFLLFAAIGALEWLVMARIVRGQTLSLREREFIEAAIASGQSRFSIIFRHIVPNLLGPVVIYTSLTIPEIISTESFLSFLGFGVQEPATSLGTLISEGIDRIEVYPWLFWFPAAFLVTLLLCLGFIGEGLRDAFDQKER